jgi:hypothetical protein
VTSTRLKRPLAAAENADVRLVGFAALEVFIFVPLYHYISALGQAAISGNDAHDRTTEGTCKDIGPPIHPAQTTTPLVGGGSQALSNLVKLIKYGRNVCAKRTVCRQREDKRRHPSDRKTLKNKKVSRKIPALPGSLSVT